MSKWKKAQMSLEMIIGLVILLVLAAVVITLFTNVFGGGVQQGEDIQSRSQVQQQCQSLCSGWQNAEGQTNTLSAAFRYCTETFQFDTDGNDIVAGETTEQGYNSYCQDSMHCFNLQGTACTRGQTTLDANQCAELVRDYYDIVEDSISTTDEIDDRMNTLVDETSGSCDLTTLTGPTGNDLTTWVDDWRP